jgi:hypothetical protein
MSDLRLTCQNKGAVAEVWLPIWRSLEKDYVLYAKRTAKTTLGMGHRMSPPGMTTVDLLCDHYG